MSGIFISQVVFEVMSPFEDSMTPPEGETQRFAAGNGSAWWLLSQVTDSGNELRSKVIKTVRATGRLTNSSAIVYGFDVEQPVDLAVMEAGERDVTKMTTRPQTFADSTAVAQTRRRPINIKNAVLSAVRIEGDDTGNTERDQVHELVLEQAIEGVRR